MYYLWKKEKFNFKLKMRVIVFNLEIYFIFCEWIKCDGKLVDLVKIYVNFFFFVEEEMLEGINSS